MGRKHGGKRRNCLWRAISPLPSVFKRLVSQGRQKVSLCGNVFKSCLLLMRQNEYLWSKGLNQNFRKTWISAVAAFCDIGQLKTFNPFPNDRFYTLPNWKSLQRTISYSIKMAESSLNRWKTLWKRRNYEQFHLFPFCFQKISTADM